MKLIYQTYHTKKALFVPADNFEKMLKEHRVKLGLHSHCGAHRHHPCIHPPTDIYEGSTAFSSKGMRSIGEFFL